MLLARPYQHMSLSSQMSNEPRVFDAALYAFQMVARYFGFAGALMLSVYAGRVADAAVDDLCNKAEGMDSWTIRSRFR